MSFSQTFLKKIGLAGLLTVNVLASAFGQTSGYEIRVKLAGLNYDTLWFGRSFGKRGSVEFFGTKQADGSFLLKNDSAKAQGQYAIIYKRAARAKYQFFPVWLADKERKWSLETNVDKPYEDAKIEGSPAEVAFFSFFKEHDKYADARDAAAFRARDLGDEASFKDWQDAEAAYRNFFLWWFGEYQDHIDLVEHFKLLWPMDFPAPGKTPEEKMLNHWRYVKQHYFDVVDPAEPTFFQSPLGIELLDYYVFKLPPPIPDSMKSAISDVFARLAKNPAHLQYYFNYVVNSYGNISKYRADEVFFWLIRNWIEAGKAPWTKPEEAAKMADEARRLEKLFVGLPSPNVTLPDRQLQLHELYTEAGTFTLLVFWNPDCSHCKKELPLLKTLVEPYYAKGLKVIAVCGKTRDQAPMCWEYADQNPFNEKWLVLHDPEAKSRMGALFNLRSFPRIFLLDKDKKILWKRAGEVPEDEMKRTLDFWVK